MSELVERKGIKIESTATLKKKTKEKKSKSKDLEHVRIIDDDAPVPWGTTTEPDTIANDEIVSIEDAPVVIGIVDERPSEIREKERFNDVKRWRTAAFEEVPEPDSIGPQPKPTKILSSSKSRQQQNSSDDSDSEIDQHQPRKKNDPDLSPPRRTTQQNDDDPSPPRRRRQSDDDPSPPRRRDLSPPRRKHDDSSPPRRRRQSDDDPSPPRRRDPSPPQRKHDDTSSSRKKHRTTDDSSPSRRYDSSPPRRKPKYNDDSNLSKRRDTSPSHKRQPRDDNDISPPRRQDKSSTSHRKNDRYSRQDSPSSTTTTNRRSKQESPPPPSQPAKSERRRLAEHKEQVTERYAQWGRGLAQVRQTEEAVKDYLEQASKPLARYRNDTDLDAMLKEREREDDPMLKYLSKRTSDVGDRTNNSNSAPPKPRYRGPDPQKNRFDIWPGYRWDGVDRSNGYEKKLFESIASRHAKSQEAYLWSVEDM
ncbi:unnamed protein product [Rotaria sp. Silwood2]|nr:unnamed protein product [Rotaria sp. Silwood2]CAF4414629.1 unnamed protein product [Rotaria sp. Silwood2]